MKKFQLTLVVSIFLLGMMPASSFAFATPKPNTSCTNPGDFGIANGQMMTCTSSSSNLIWELDPNVIAGGLCSPWTPGDTSDWAELELLIQGKWVTQILPIAFTPGPTCDNTKVNSSIPWAALPHKIAEGTKYRWVRGVSGKDGHGGRAFGQGYTNPVMTYTAKAMKARYLKVYTAIVSPIEGPHVYAALNPPSKSMLPSEAPSPSQS
jgi:hypothetical protein